MDQDAELLRHELRRQARARRRALSEEDRELAAEQCGAHLMALPVFVNARQIGAYAAVASELSLSRVIDFALSRSQAVYLPHIEHSAPQMHFAPWSGQRRLLMPNRFGIPEPLVDASQLLFADRLDVILLPLLAFDRHGGRLGSGAGYYDRALNFRLTQAAPPWLIGVGYACQEVPHIPLASWDVRLDFVVTEDEVISVTPEESQPCIG